MRLVLVLLLTATVAAEQSFDSQESAGGLLLAQDAADASQTARSLRCPYSAPARISYAWTSPPRSTATSRSPICRPVTSKSPRMTYRRPSRRSSSCGSTAPGPRTSTSRSRFARSSTPFSRPRAKTFGCSRCSWTTTTSTSGPTSRCRCAKRSPSSSSSWVPTISWCLMDPLTTLYDLKYTRAKDDLLQRVRNFEGRRGQAYPVKSAIEEAQLTQRNWLELRAGVTLSALEALATQMGGLREGRKSILFFSQGPPLPPSSPNESALSRSHGSGQSRQRHHPRDRSAPAGVGWVWRRQHAAPDRRRHRRPRDRQHQRSDRTAQRRDGGCQRVLPDRLHADAPRERWQVPRDQGAREAARRARDRAAWLLVRQREGD